MNNVTKSDKATIKMNLNKYKCNENALCFAYMYQKRGTVITHSW